LLDGTESKIDIWRYFGVDIATKLGIADSEEKRDNING
jgi:hypothetical protein